MDDINVFSQLVSLIRDGGAIAALLAVIVAIWKRILVPGWIYDGCARENERLNAVGTARADKLEAKLERLEQERWMQGTRREIP